MHFLFFGVTTLGEDQTSCTLLKKANSAKNTRSRRFLALMSQGPDMKMSVTRQRVSASLGNPSELAT